MASPMKFHLTEEFMTPYKAKKPKFGFNALGEIAYKRSYARLKENGETEEWFETVERVVNGTFNMQRRFQEEQGRVFDEEENQKKAQKMYEKIFNFKFLPPGRGLWAMGTKLTEEKKLFASLNNCAFVSTDYSKEIPESLDKFVKSFVFLMDASMLGVGVGFDCKGAGKVQIPGSDLERTEEYIIADSREGWVKSQQRIIESYVYATPDVVMDYSLIRPEGTLLKGFGGIASGPAPLKTLHQATKNIFERYRGEFITSMGIVDLMNMIGKCVVAGNIRRTAEIAFGEPDDEEFLNLKNYEINPQRAEFGWTSNNSIFATLGMDYRKACENIIKNGEPGFCWLENMRKFGRMGDEPNYKDKKAAGGNPCLEQTLESYEMCCLVETFPYNHDSYEEFEETLQSAFLYAKTVTLGLTHWEETNQVIRRNRRIGTSMSGIVQFVGKFGLDKLKDFCNKGYQFLTNYDIQLSAEFDVNPSIKITSIKPSGTVSLLAGATPGIHFPQSKFYIRRIRIGAGSELVRPLTTAGYFIEKDHYSRDGKSLVVEIPIKLGNEVRSLKEVSMWEQLSLAAFFQKHWADNQVSITVTFDPETEGPQLPIALDFYQYQLKGVSFLPKMEEGQTLYVQMPYEEITEDKYYELMLNIKPLNFKHAVDSKPADPMADLFCDGDNCMNK